jgi:hypothetical protein
MIFWTGTSEHTIRMKEFFEELFEFGFVVDIATEDNVILIALWTVRMFVIGFWRDDCEEIVDLWRDHDDGEEDREDDEAFRGGGGRRIVAIADTSGGDDHVVDASEETVTFTTDERWLTFAVTVLW